MSTEIPKPPTPAEATYIYRLDPETMLPVTVGKVFVKENGEAWVLLNKDAVASGLGMTNINGMALLTEGEFESQEPE